MKHTTDRHAVPCNCRSVGECTHHQTAEALAIRHCVAEFADALLAKLLEKMNRAGKAGWDDPDWPRERIIDALRKHVDKGDMIDVAAFAMFAWNQEGGTA